MAVSRRNVHMYLGMTLGYKICGRVKIAMFDYIEEIITAFEKAEPGKSGTKYITSPVILFVVDEDCKNLNLRKVLALHNLVANNIYATK